MCMSVSMCLKLKCLTKLSSVMFWHPCGKSRKKMTGWANWITDFFFFLKNLPLYIFFFLFFFSSQACVLNGVYLCELKTLQLIYFSNIHTWTLNFTEWPLDFNAESQNDPQFLSAARNIACVLILHSFSHLLRLDFYRSYIYIYIYNTFVALMTEAVYGFS